MSKLLRRVVKFHHLVPVRFFLLLILITGSHQLQQVVVDVTPEYVLLHAPLKLTCTFGGDDVDLQYVTWSRVLRDGRRTFVFEYDKVTNTSRAYNGYDGRLTYQLEEPVPGLLGQGHEVWMPLQTRRGIRKRRASSKRWRRDEDRMSLVTGDNKRRRRDDNSFVVYNANASSYIYTSDVTIGQTLRVGQGSLSLLIHSARLTDDGVYECTVKSKDGPPLSHARPVNVIVLPGQPVVELVTPQKSNGALYAGENAIITCSTNVGKPAGTLVWSRKLANERDFRQVANDYVSTSQTRHQNGTTSAESSYVIRLTANDDGAVYRCTVDKHRIVSAVDDTAVIADKTLTVEYPPADVSVFASGANRFVCRARGNPPPVFVWLMLGDSNKTVITTSPLLDLGQVTASGQFRFLCMVSNVVNGRRFEVNKDIELNVRGSQVLPLESTTEKPSTTTVQTSPMLTTPSTTLATTFSPVVSANNTKPTSNQTTQFDATTAVKTTSTAADITTTLTIVNTATTTPTTIATQPTDVVQLPTVATASATEEEVNEVIERVRQQSAGIVRAAARADVTSTSALPPKVLKNRQANFAIVRKKQTPEAKELQLRQSLLKVKAKQPVVTSADHNLLLPDTNGDLLTLSGGEENEQELVAGNVAAEDSTANDNFDIEQLNNDGVATEPDTGAADYIETSIPVDIGREVLDSPSPDADLTHLDLNAPSRDDKLTNQELVLSKNDRSRRKQDGNNEAADNNLVDLLEQEIQNLYKAQQQEQGQQFQKSSYIAQPKAKVDSTNKETSNYAFLRELADSQLTHDSTGAFRHHQQHQSLHIANTRERLPSSLQPGRKTPITISQSQKKQMRMQQQPGKHSRGFVDNKRPAIDNLIQQPETFGTPDTPWRSYSKVQPQQDVKKLMNPDKKFDCRQLPDGVYGGGCRSFVRCQGGVTLNVDCRAPHVFNRRTGNCDRPENVSGVCGQQRDCSRRQDRMYADRSLGCGSYFTCENGQFFGINQCNNGLVFNEESQSCDWAQNVAPPCGKAQ